MNIGRKLFRDAEVSHISPFWRGHLFLFDKPQESNASPRSGYKLLLLFLVFEGVVRPLLAAGARRLSVADSNWWPLIQMSFLCFSASWLVTKFSGVRLSQLGLYSWQRWSKTEKLYFLQIIPIAIAVFSFFVFASLKILWARPDLWKIGLFIFASKMIWGFYQELMYRGVLQTELVRRWGSGWGILVSNLIFTFGPLHAYHFLSASRNHSHLWIFAAIFAIGLFFAILFKRSGNLWIVGVMHGLGDWFIDGLAEVSRMSA